MSRKLRHIAKTMSYLENWYFQKQISALWSGYEQGSTQPHDIEQQPKQPAAYLSVAEIFFVLFVILWRELPGRRGRSHLINLGLQSGGESGVASEYEVVLFHRGRFILFASERNAEIYAGL